MLEPLDVDSAYSLGIGRVDDRRPVGKWDRSGWCVGVGGDGRGKILVVAELEGEGWWSRVVPSWNAGVAVGEAVCAAGVSDEVCRKYGMRRVA